MFNSFRSYNSSTKLKASGKRERENTGMTVECKGNGSIETDGSSDGHRSMYDGMFTGEYDFSRSSSPDFHNVVTINLNAKRRFLSHQFLNYNGKRSELRQQSGGDPPFSASAVGNGNHCLTTVAAHVSHGTLQSQKEEEKVKNS